MRKIYLIVLLFTILLSSCTRNYCYTSYEQTRLQARNHRQHMKIMKRKYGYSPYKKRK